VPFKSKKQKTYLAINEPEVYKKFKKEEQNMYGKKMVKRPMGGKVYKNIVKRPMGGKVYKVDNKGQQLVAKQYGGKIHG
jgi:biotin carboxyl carrier protein